MNLAQTDRQTDRQNIYLQIQGGGNYYLSLEVFPLPIFTRREVSY